jgi:hypothetical protein
VKAFSLVLFVCFAVPISLLDDLPGSLKCLTCQAIHPPSPCAGKLAVAIPAKSGFSDAGTFRPTAAMNGV